MQAVEEGCAALKKKCSDADALLEKKTLQVGVWVVVVVVVVVMMMMMTTTMPMMLLLFPHLLPSGCSRAESSQGRRRQKKVDA